MRADAILGLTRVAWIVNARGALRRPRRTSGFASGPSWDAPGTDALANGGVGVPSAPPSARPEAGGGRMADSLVTHVGRGVRPMQREARRPLRL